MADALRQVQAPTPLHASYLWPLQQAWHASHAEQAARVWTESATPIFATSNAYIASAYARVILGLLRDWFAAPPAPAAGSSGSATAAPPRDEPVRILEAGAGHGRLAYLVLRELWSLEEHWPAVPSGGKFGGVVGAGGRPVPFRVVITDVMGGCVDFWRAHESLQPFLAAGVLDLGVLDATGEGSGSSSGTCVLQPSGLRLAPGALRAPLVVLANYLFSSLRQDLVALEGGVAQQARVAIFSPQASDADASQPPAGQAQAQPDPTLISRMRLVWSYGPRAECVCARRGRAFSGPHPSSRSPHTPPPSPLPPPSLPRSTTYPFLDAATNAFVPALLAHYAAALPTGTVPLPVGGLAAMAHLSALTTAHTVLLVGDKGYNHAEEMAGAREPHLGLHGCFSFMANLHAARLYALHRGGHSLHTPYLEGLKCAALVLWGGGGGGGGAPRPPRDAPSLAAADAQLLPAHVLAALPAFCSAWNDAMDGFGPDAFATLQRRVAEETRGAEEGRPSLKTALATLRLACWDPDVFVKLKGSLIDGAPGASERLQHDMYRDVCRVYERYFPLRPSHDVAFECGRVCMGLRRYPEAIALFLASMRQCGEHHVTAHNCGICLFHLARFPAAAEAFQKALALAPSYAEASHWLHRAQERAQGREPQQAADAQQPHRG